MSDNQLRDGLVKLGAAHPELRVHIRPLLTKEASGSSFIEVLNGPLWKINKQVCIELIKRINAGGSKNLDIKDDSTNPGHTFIKIQSRSAPWSLTVSVSIQKNGHFFASLSDDSSQLISLDLVPEIYQWLPFSKIVKKIVLAFGFYAVSSAIEKHI